jgi:hypothetical protein
MNEVMNEHTYEQDISHLLVHVWIMVVFLGKFFWEYWTPTLNGLVRIHANLICSMFHFLFLVCYKFLREPPPWNISDEGGILSPRVTSCLSINEKIFFLVFCLDSLQYFGFNLYYRKCPLI